MGFWKSVGDAAVGGLTGGLKGVISSGIGSLFGGLFGSKGPSQEDLMKWQEGMLDKQLNFQSDQAGLNRAFQADQASKSRQWNSIVQQLQRARDAGVNPFSLVASGQYGSAGSSPTPSGSMAGSGFVPQPAPNTRLQQAEAFSATAAGLSALAEAKQKGVNTEYLERSLDDLVRKARADADNAELVNNYQRIVNKWQDKLSAKQYSKLNHQIDVLISTDWKNLKDLDEANARINNLMAEFKLKSAQYEELRRFLDVWFDKERQSIIDLRSAQAGAASATALRDTALAGQAQQYTRNLEQIHELQGYDIAIRKASNEAEKNAAVQQYVQAAKQYGLITDQMSEALKRAVKDNDWYTYDKIMGGISAIAGAYGNVMGARAGMMNAGANMMNAVGNQKPVRVERHGTHGGKYYEDHETRWKD